MNEDNLEPQEAVPFTVRQSKQWRVDLDAILQEMKHGPVTPKDEEAMDHRTSRERSLAITKTQEAIMWLGMDLKAQRVEGIHKEPSPYPQGYNPDSKEIEPPAQGLEL